jgi:hypothetical protein
MNSTKATMVEERKARQTVVLHQDRKGNAPGFWACITGNGTSRKPKNWLLFWKGEQGGARPQPLLLENEKVSIFWKEWLRGQCQRNQGAARPSALLKKTKNDQFSEGVDARRLTTKPTKILVKNIGRNGCAARPLWLQNLVWLEFGCGEMAEDYMTMALEEAAPRSRPTTVHNPSAAERLHAGLNCPIPETNKGHQLL